MEERPAVHVGDVRLALGGDVARELDLQQAPHVVAERPAGDGVLLLLEPLELVDLLGEDPFDAVVDLADDDLTGHQDRAGGGQGEQRDGGCDHTEADARQEQPEGAGSDVSLLLTFREVLRG